MEEKRGKTILIEGTDCSGKETQSKLLLERLKKENISVEVMSFPRYYTPSGRIVGQCYLGKDKPSPGAQSWQGDTAWFEEADLVDPKVASLYYAADRRAALPEIKAILNSGKNIIFNRYVESNMGHQGGKIIDSEERAKLIKFIEELEYNLLELPQPDVVIFLYMPHQIASKLKAGRAGAADKHEANINHLIRAEKCYLELAEKRKWVKINCAPDGTIDSLKTPEQIHEEVYWEVGKLLKHSSSHLNIKNLTLNELKEIIMQQAREKGFGTTPEEVNTSEKMALIHSEISEAFEAYRKKNIDGKDGFKEELGDAVQRILHLCGVHNIDIEQEILKKISSNKGRLWNWYNLNEKHS